MTRTFVHGPVMEPLLWGRLTVLRPANRGFTAEEQRRRFEWSKDTDLQYWSGSIPSGRTFNEFQRTLRERDWPANGSRRSYAILDKTGQLIGMVSCYSIDWRERSGELGVYIGEREMWNQGLGTDAITTLLRHVFLTLDLRRIYLHTYQTNTRAIRSYEKVGFAQVASRRRFRPNTGYYREVKMELDRNAFLASHAADNQTSLGNVTEDHLSPVESAPVPPAAHGSKS